MTTNLSQLWYLTKEYLDKENFDYQYYQVDEQCFIEITTVDYITYEFEVDPVEVLAARHKIQRGAYLPYCEEVIEGPTVVFPSGNVVDVFDIEIEAKDIWVWLNNEVFGTQN